MRRRGKTIDAKFIRDLMHLGCNQERHLFHDWIIAYDADKIRAKFGDI
jgi:hypothetical protein